MTTDVQVHYGLKDCYWTPVEGVPIEIVLAYESLHKNDWLWALNVPLLEVSGGKTHPKWNIAAN